MRRRRLVIMVTGFLDERRSHTGIRRKPPRKDVSVEKRSRGYHHGDFEGRIDRGFVNVQSCEKGRRQSQDALEDRIAQMAGMTIAERALIPGLDGRRADIILAGAILLSHTLSHLEATSLSVSTRGLRWGIIYDRFLAHS